MSISGPRPRGTRRGAAAPDRAGQPRRCRFAVLDRGKRRRCQRWRLCRFPGRHVGWPQRGHGASLSRLGSAGLRERQRPDRRGVCLLRRRVADRDRLERGRRRHADSRSSGPTPRARRTAACA